ncbi:MAG: DUF790 family protein [Candidatus Bathyarchaeia archaeon]
MIRVRRRKGRIKPLFAGEESIGLAKTLFAVYDSHRGERRGPLQDALTECEQLGYNYKLIRGMSDILESLCVFQSQSVVDPRQARSLVFKEAGRRVVANRKDRSEVLAKVAMRLGIKTKELEESLYADLKDEHRLVNFEKPDALELIKRYNFGLAVALLAHSTKLSFTHSGSNSYLVRLARKLGGEYASTQEDAFMHITLKKTKKLAYRASRLEELMAQLMNEDGWSLKASIVYPARFDRAYLMELTEEEDGAWMMPPSFEEEIIIEIPDKSEGKEDYGEIIVLEEIARKMGTTERDARKAVLEAGGDYRELGGVLIADEIYEEIVSALEAEDDLDLGSAMSVLKERGCSTPLPILESMGYIIDWRRPREKSSVYRL